MSRIQTVCTLALGLALGTFGCDNEEEPTTPVVIPPATVPATTPADPDVADPDAADPDAADPGAGQDTDADATDAGADAGADTDDAATASETRVQAAGVAIREFQAAMEAKKYNEAEGALKILQGIQNPPAEIKAQIQTMQEQLEEARKAGGEIESTPSQDPGDAGDAAQPPDAASTAAGDENK